MIRDAVPALRVSASARVLSGCNNYALVGDGTNTYINRPTGGSIFFREHNGSEMTIAPGGAVAITESLSGVFAPALNATSKSEGSFGMWAFGGGGSSESGTGGGGLLAEGGTETNTDSMFGGDGVDTSRRRRVSRGYRRVCPGRHQHTGRWW